VTEEIDYPVAGGASDSGVDCANAGSVPGHLGGIRIHPFGRIFQGNLAGLGRNIGEQHVVAARAAHADVVPGLDDANAGRIRAHQDVTNLVPMRRPQIHPAQARCAGGEYLVPRKRPPVGCLPQDRRGPAGPARGTQLRLYTQRVDKRSVAHRLGRDPRPHGFRPHLAPVQRGQFEQLHGEDQAGRGASFRDDSEHTGGVDQTAACAAVSLGTVNASSPASRRRPMLAAGKLASRSTWAASAANARLSARRPASPIKDDGCAT
jgi:hypothetical protein